MIVEPVPTNPRSPLGRALRLAGMVAPAALLLAVVAAGVLGPRTEPPPAPPPATAAAPSQADGPASGPPSSPVASAGPAATPAPWAIEDAPPRAFDGIEVVPLATLVQQHAASRTMGLVAIDGWLAFPETSVACAATPLGAMGPWCRRMGIIAAEPWTSIGAITRPLPAHLRVTVPVGIRLAEPLLATTDAAGGAPVRVLLLGWFGREGRACDSAMWGACEAGFIVERIVYAEGSRVGLTTLLAPGLDREPRANPLASVADQGIPLLAVYARPDVIGALDPATTRLGAPAASVNASWYLRWWDRSAGDLRWRILDGRTLAPLGEGRVGPSVVNAERAPVAAPPGS